MWNLLMDLFHGIAIRFEWIKLLEDILFSSFLKLGNNLLKSLLDVPSDSLCSDSKQPSLALINARTYSILILSA